jgi:hypothetical protein
MITRLTRWIALIIASVFAAFISHTTTYSLGAWSKLPMKLITSEPDQFRIQISNWEPQQLDAEGRGVLNLPGFCVRNSYIFGIRYSGDNPWKEPIVKIVKNENLLATMSIEDIKALPKDENGYHELKQ